MRILIVDDEPVIAQTLSTIFSRHGFEVSTAYNVMEALGHVMLARPDLVLCDLDMPSRDGVGLMEDLSREAPGVPILMLTGFVSGLERVREAAAELHQNVTILTKPCRPTDLLRHAGTLLQSA